MKVWPTLIYSGHKKYNRKKEKKAMKKKAHCIKKYQTCY